MGNEKERLDKLGEDIERQRKDIGDAQAALENEQQFIDSGEQGPVDDSIAPPG